MTSVPAGAILKRILRQNLLSQKELSARTAIYPRLISDLISGNRKFTPELSFRIEEVLGITIPGYFYRIQTNHDIYRYQDEQERKHSPDLSKLNKSLFWETPSFDRINWSKQANWIIQRVFEYGNQQAIEEIIRYYGRAKVSEILNAIPPSDTWKIKDRNQNRKEFKV
jgi:plasmid maintenance system antidote protein VapI